MSALIFPSNFLPLVKTFKVQIMLICVYKKVSRISNWRNPDIFHLSVCNLCPSLAPNKWIMVYFSLFHLLNGNKDTKIQLLKVESQIERKTCFLLQTRVVF